MSALKRILCYGDSLTAGFYLYGSQFHPYGDTLSSLSGQTVDTIGMSGWTTEQMIESFDMEECYDCVGEKGQGLRYALSQNEYDIVCLMAGTNDLATDDEVGDIMRNINHLINVCKTSNNSMQVLAFTVPPSGADFRLNSLRIKKENLNNMIKAAVQSDSNLHLVETCIPLPGVETKPETPTEVSDLWDNDLLHFSPRGSEKLAIYVYNQLKDLNLI